MDQAESVSRVERNPEELVGAHPFRVVITDDPTPLTDPEQEHGSSQRSRTYEAVLAWRFSASFGWRRFSFRDSRAWG